MDYLLTFNETDLNEVFSAVWGELSLLNSRVGVKGFYLPVGVDLRLNSPSAICILSHLLFCALKPSQGAQEHVLFLKLKDKCATQGAPSIVSDGVTCHGRLMIRLCDG